MGLTPAWCWISAVPLPFCVALSPSVHWHTRFLYCCALYNVFFLGFRQWRSRTDRVLTLNMNIRLPLFWSTWSPARGPDSATCAGLAHGRDYSYCRASELKLQKFLATVYSWIVENTWKTMATEKVFQTSPTWLNSYMNSSKIMNSYMNSWNEKSWLHTWIHDFEFIHIWIHDFEFIYEFMIFHEFIYELMIFHICILEKNRWFRVY